MATDNLKSIINLPDVSFIDNDTLNDMVTRLVANYEARYEELTGTAITLAPADPMRLLIYAAALELYQIEAYVDRAGKQDLLKYSYGDYLDNLAANRGVTRLPASAATTTLRFTLSAAMGYDIIIPAGTRVTNANGISAGDTTVDVAASCTEVGTAGNDILAGQLSVIVDAVNYVASVTNLTETSGGANIETDASLAERVFLAPSAYSVAGPAEAYIYHVKSFDASIGSVTVLSPSACVVNIYVLNADGTLPDSDTVDAISDYIESAGIRPLTDQVNVNTPTSVSFDVDLTYYVNSTDTSAAASIQAAVADAVDEYVKWQTTQIGRDVNPSELIKRVILAGAKRVTVTSPTFTQLTDTQVAQLDSKTVTYGGVEDD